MRRISLERTIRRSVSWMRSSTRPISSRRFESRRLAVSSTPPALVEAGGDRVGDPAELADSLTQGAQAGELVADAAEPAVEVADRPQDLRRLGQFLGIERGAGLRRDGPGRERRADPRTAA